jgi:sugar phosphate isomerase/epimerase
MRFKLAVTIAEDSPGNAPLLLTGRLIDSIKKAAEIGYDGVELHTREDAALDFSGIREALDETKLRISAIATGRLNTQAGLNLSDESDLVVKGAIDGLRKYIALAARFDTDLIVGWLVGNIPCGCSSAVYHRRLADSLEVVSREAADSGVKIFIEVINRYESNFFNTATSLSEFLSDNKLSNCFIHLDTFHMGIEEIDPLGSIGKAGNMLGYVHVADNTRLRPGAGTVNFPLYFNKLAEIGYDGWLSVECLPRPDGEIAAKEAFDYLNYC